MYFFWSSPTSCKLQIMSLEFLALKLSRVLIHQLQSREYESHGSLDPTILMRFEKSPFSFRRNRSKIFSPTLAFSFCFHLSTLMHFDSKTETWRVFAYHPHWLKRPKTLMEAIVEDAFFRHRFQKPPFSPVHSTLKTKHFQNDAFAKDFTFETVFNSLRFYQRFSSF